MAEAATRTETRFVKPGPTAEQGKVILSEWNPAHPTEDHEVFIAAPGSLPNDKPAEPVEVALTSAVMEHLKEGRLVEVRDHQPAAIKAAESEQAAGKRG